MFLRQSTASQSRIVGPFIDDTDGKTPETALTIANTDIKLMKNGAANVNKNSGGGTHRVNGEYSVTFDATDTDTVGELRVSVVVSGALPVFTTFMVVEEAIYDFLYASGAGTIDGRTLQSVLEILVAVAAGKINGAGSTTVNIRNLGDTLNRVVATVDVDGNRSAITLT